MTFAKGKMLSFMHLVTIAAIVFTSLFCLSLSVSADSTDNVDGQKKTVDVIVDGKKTPCLVNGKTTVEEQLNKLGVTLEQMDTVEPALGSYIKENSTIKVSRKRWEKVTETGTIKHEIVYEYSPDVIAGTETVLQEGEDGHGERIYDVLMVDGVEAERKLVTETLTKEPVTKKIGTGFRSTLVSPYNFEWKFDENGEPLNAKNVLRGQKSTAYTATGFKTSTGREAAEGHVAVNPSVIPYGSKLFIQSNDGKHIYGYAIAADTGGALLNGNVAVDLYYDTQSECVKYGVKNVDIFILE